MGCSATGGSIRIVRRGQLISIASLIANRKRSEPTELKTLRRHSFHFSLEWTKASRWPLHNNGLIGNNFFFFKENPLRLDPVTPLHQLWRSFQFFQLKLTYSTSRILTKCGLFITWAIHGPVGCKLSINIFITQNHFATSLRAPGSLL